jgi:hypothetical protein
MKIQPMTNKFRSPSEVQKTCNVIFSSTIVDLKSLVILTKVVTVLWPKIRQPIATIDMPQHLIMENALKRLR